MIEVERGKPIWAMGLMSGTSMDGVDAAMLMTDGEEIVTFGRSADYSYTSDEVWAVQRVASDWKAHRPPTNHATEHTLTSAEEQVVAVHVSAVRAAISTSLEDEAVYTDPRNIQQLARDAIWGEDIPQQRRLIQPDRTSGLLSVDVPSIIGFHGQTVAHSPEEGWTWQIANGDALAQTSGVDVAWDFRTDDMEAGGQGAPLAPFYHFALAKHICATEPVVFLNIGGVANITWVDPRKELPEEPGALMAFDTGPGNALVNDWMYRNTNCLVMDVDGATASTGRVHRDRLKTNWGKDYLRKPGPKSLDRNDFHGILSAMQGLSINDGAATLTAFTADCVAESLRHMPSPPTRWLVCGGGRHNHTMMQRLQDRFDAPVEPVEAVGLDGDMLEAQAFAYLAVRVLRGLPTSAPSTTGCREPVCGGRISYPT